jgi:Periplasmic glucan biosynthesis protein, MdoG/Domain of unknown function (DUF4214)/Putative Ig domain
MKLLLRHCLIPPPLSAVFLRGPGRRPQCWQGPPCLEELESRALLAVQMNLAILQQQALALAQGAFARPQPESIGDLDPPPSGRREDRGLTYQEALDIRTKNLFDNGVWYDNPRPRAATDRLPLETFIDPEGDGSYEPKTYGDANPDYTDRGITPPIDTAQLPPAARVLSRTVLGHLQQTPAGAHFPEVANFGADGYTRFNGFEPMTVGASYRLASHNVFAAAEDFPFVRQAYVSILNPQTANVLLLVDSEAFTGALSVNVTPGPQTVLAVDATWFPRRLIERAREPETGFITFASMFFRDERDTPTVSTDEAHDSDTVTEGFDNNGDGVPDRLVERGLNNPGGAGSLVLTDLTSAPFGRIVFFSLENRDRNAAHYSTFADADYAARGSYGVRIWYTSTPLGLHLHEQHTDSEVNDNIVLNAVIQNDLPAARSLADGVHLVYDVTAFYPDDSDADGLTDFFESLVATDPHRADTDGDGRDDGVELRDGTCPVGDCPPQLEPLGAQQVAEGSLLTFTARATDRDGKAVRFELAAGAPDGAAIDPMTGVFTWTPAESQGPGSYPITVIARNAAVPQLIQAQTFTTTVTEVNAPPVLAPIANPIVAQGDRLSLHLTASDPDQPNNHLTFSLAAGAPPGAAIDPDTGVFTWVAVAPGLFPVTVLVTDDGAPPQTDRLTFAVTVTRPADEQFVAALYHDVLDRAPDQPGLASWLSLLHRGGSREQVAQGFWESPEHRGLQVDQLYDTYLGRAAEPTGRAFWVGAFANGASEFDVARQFVLSTEYNSLHASNDAFVQELYRDILGREPDAEGFSSWLTRLQRGASRDAVALGFLGSQEHRRKLLDILYADLLNRSIDPVGEQTWDGLLQAGTPLTRVAEGILASAEYFHRSEGRLLPE